MLLKQGHVHSQQFKTSGTYGYQPISVDSNAKICIELFLTHYRPAVNPCGPEDFVFANWEGSGAVSITIEVKKFFQIHCHLNLGPNLIRSLVETVAETLQRTSKITQEERASVSNISGHSSAVVKKHYLLMDRNHDVNAMRRMFHELNGEEADETEFEPVVENTKHNMYGTGHPEYANVHGKRITWTNEEITYLTQWKEANVQDPGEPYQLRRCLKAIVGDTAAHPIFHHHHLETPQRLRSGYEKA